MKFIFGILLLLAIFVSPAFAEEETCDMLFVQNASAMTFDGIISPRDADSAIETANARIGIRSKYLTNHSKPDRDRQFTKKED